MFPWMIPRRSARSKMGFLQDFERTLAERCHQNEPPFCQAACPFHMDIKGLEEKWKKGRFNAAYRMFQNAVGFPQIVSELCERPCEAACIRAQADRAVSLGLMERATVDFAKRKAPNAYNMPSKGRKIAVIGGGLSGLGCALRLSNKKYEVTVFERSDSLGGRARDLMDPGLFDAEIENQFQFESWERRMGTEITSLEPLRAEFEAIYVATGEGGRRFGLTEAAGGAYATEIPGIFIGGGVTGAGSVEALAQGLEASLAAERYLKTGMMNEPFRKKGTLIRVDAERLARREAIVPANGSRYTQEEAMEEIGRCVKCSCDACMKACDLMRINEKTPRRIYEEVYITIHPGTLSRDGTWATRLITTCDQCGLCKQVCPQDIDFGSFFLEARRAMHEKGAMPWPYHDFWLRDMEFSSGEAKLCRKPAGAEKSRYAFFPGCQLAASDARYVTRTYAWLTERMPDTAIWMTCCGAAAEWAGDRALHGAYVENLRQEWETLGRPEVIFACPNCRRLFEQYLPEIPGIFLSEIMAGQMEWGADAAGGETETGKNRALYAVFDPCAGRGYPQLQTSVRALADSLGILWENLPYDGENARCCGYGGHINIASPNFVRKVARDRVKDADTPYLTSCVNCRESFAGQGKEAVHFLDLAFGLNGGDRPTVTVTERRRQRLAAKKQLLEARWNETMEEKTHMKLTVSKELEKKLSDSQILLEDMEQVIAFCEREGRGTVQPGSGRITGHLKIQNMTYWAEYETLEDGSFKLCNGYCHRMNLEGE